MSMRTPLGRVRGLGSAKDGTDHFWKQRVTAVANVPLILFFIVIMVSLMGADHGRVLDVLSNPFVCVLMILTMVTACLHMKLGMQMIIEDYVHGETAKIVLLLASTFFSVVIGALSVFALLKIGFGG